MKSVTKIVFFFIFLIYSCEKISETSKETIPLAPDELSINLLSPTKVELNWIDKSTNEQNFIIERKLKDQSFSKLVEVNKDVTKYIDSNLSINQFYTYRVYTTNTAGKSQSYSNEFTVHTKSIPIVTTVIPKNILRTSFTSGGSIVNDGGQQISSKGLVWSTQPNATISLTTKVLNTTQNNSFENSVTNLKANTEYYVRAFAINSLGVGYGEELKVTTLKVGLPITELTIYDSLIGYSYVGCRFQLIDNGDGKISQMGFCISTKSNPTLNDSTTKFNFGGPSGVVYNMFRRKLMPSTKYYLKSFATNEAGTSYGQEISFSTKISDEVLYDSRDFTYYPVNKIGNQFWMIENMNYNPNWRQNTEYYHEVYLVNNIIDYCRGVQYSVKTIADACPIGWRVPTVNDYEILVNSYGGDRVAGQHLKSTSKEWLGWKFNTNSSRFEVLPSYYKDGSGTRYSKQLTDFHTSNSTILRINDGNNVSGNSNTGFYPAVESSLSYLRCIKN